MPRLWWLILLAAGAFVIFADVQRARRALHITNIDREQAVVDRASSTGYAGGKRWLIVPENHNRSYQWIAETQQMLAQGEWRVRRIDTENAPYGREVHSASPYRWWLAFVAWWDETLSVRPTGIAVERAALWSDPLLHLLLLALTTIFTARWFGAASAASFAAACATLYPFAGAFLPGVPQDRGLTAACALWSVLPLLAALRPSGPADGPGSQAPTKPDESRSQRLFLIAGIAGGFGLWIGAPHQVIVILGVALGALLGFARNAGRARAKEIPSLRLPWRTWAIGGALVSLLGYLVEYFPANMALRVEVNHPLHALAWLGVGEMLGLLQDCARERRGFWTTKRLVLLVAAVLAIAVLPVTAGWTKTALFPGELSDSRLVNLPQGAVARSLTAWLARDGFTIPSIAVCLSFAVVGLAAWSVLREQARETRAAFAIGLGPVLATVAIACARLAWWQIAGAVLIPLIVLALADWRASVRRRSWSAVLGAAVVAGTVALLPPSAVAGSIELTKTEVEALLERELAHWIADRAPASGGVVFGPPARTVRWCFHGGLRGIGSANWENRDGLAASVRIATATGGDEAQALLNERGITHLVLPSWDTDLNEFARWSHSNPNDAFIMALHNWALPTWLRPLPYRLPRGTGFEEQSVAVFALTEDSNRAASLSQLAEYFLEMGEIEKAAALRDALRRYPTDLGALVALARIEKTRGDNPAFVQAFQPVQTSVTNGLDRMIAWDRRVSLAVVLTWGGRAELAREQVRRCLTQINPDRIRSITTGSLYQLLVLAKAHDLAIEDPAQRALALRLLPAELRGRL